jgi:hypothetical protein
MEEWYMSIKTFVGNMKNLWQEQNASKPYVDTEIDKAKAEIISFINKNEMKASMEQIETLALNNKMEIEELLNMLDPVKDKLRTLNNNMETIQFIVDTINTKKNNTHKPNTPHYPVIDEEYEKEKRLAELLKLVGIAGSESQMRWIFDIETDLKDIPKFKGTTQREVKRYIDNYKMKHNLWKKEHGVSRASKNQYKGVGHSYGM